MQRSGVWERLGIATDQAFIYHCIIDVGISGYNKWYDSRTWIVRAVQPCTLDIKSFKWTQKRKTKNIAYHNQFDAHEIDPREVIP